MTLEPGLQGMYEGSQVQFYQFVIQTVDCEIRLTGYRGSKHQTIWRDPGHNLLLKKLPCVLVIFVMLSPSYTQLTPKASC